MRKNQKPRNVTPIEFPMQERLLPIGMQKDSVTGVVERVRQGIRSSELQGTHLTYKFYLSHKYD